MRAEALAESRGPQTGPPGRGFHAGFRVGARADAMASHEPPSVNSQKNGINPKFSEGVQPNEASNLKKHNGVPIGPRIA